MITYFPFNYKKIKCDTMVELNPTVFGGIPPYTYSWDSGENTASITKGPGTYKLTVTDAKGCKDVQSVVLDGQLNVDFNFEKACAKSKTRFYDTTYSATGIVARLWNFGDGTTDTAKYPAHIYNLPGKYIVTLKETDHLGCSITLGKNLQICNRAEYTIEIVSDTFVIKQSDDSKCKIFTNVGLKNISTDTSSCELATDTQWDWGNGGTSSGTNLQRFIYTVSGVYTITAIVLTKNCVSDTLTKTVKILDSPEAFLTSQDFYQRCDTGANKLVLASVTSVAFAPYNFRWAFNDIPDDNITASGYNITTTGVYNVTVTNALMAKKIMCVESKKPLYSKFAPDDFCLRTSSISMNNQTTLAGSYFGISFTGWDFGDGATDYTNKYNPSHNYLYDSVFTATVYEVDSAGCKDTSSQTVATYLPYDTLQVTSDPLSCFSEKIEFKGPKGKSINSYKWTFGTGEYVVTLVGVAIADSSVQAGNPPLEIDKQYAFSGSDGYYLPLYPGKKNILLEVTYNNTCTKNYYDTTHVFKQLKVDAEIDGQRCVGKVLSFTGRVLKQGDYPIKTWWMGLSRDPTVAVPIFLDTNTTGLPYSFSGQSFSFAFSEQDNNLLRVKVADANPFRTCLADTTLDASINNIKAPNFTFQNSCVNTQITFVKPEIKDLYETQDSLIVYFGDDSVRYYSGKLSQDIYHTYSDTGVFNLKFKVINLKYNCIDSLVKQHSIYGLPVPDFSYGLVCEKNTTYFENKSTPARNIHPIVKSTWIVETDTTRNRLQSISHNFGIEGIYSVRLSVEDTLGCKGDTVKQVTAYPKPRADFYFDKENAFAFKAVPFTDKSIAGNSNSVITSWLWHFGDGDSSSLQSPDHIYGDVKIFNASLLVTNQFGCIDDTTQEVDLNPYLLLPTAFSPNGDQLNDELLLVTKGIKSIDNFKIYNRWGELVFETRDIKTGWDGHFNGVKQPAGVYQYYVTGKSVYDQEMKPLHGNLLLVY